ncbi:MAG: hypothetical protein A6F71_03000 [Cycloclasticus sp. symbiont of Poecilosclerida sp. M]|nr:MAG: hypothetical protein A6F71_03000 [Cycloclasticus sp. symbiont of Poecilosclerida sp. M]
MSAITYSLKKIDLLEFNEYHAKMTGVYGKSITRHQILWPFILAALALYIVLVQKDEQLGVLFLMLAFIWSLIIPSILKKRFHDHVSGLYSHKQIADATGKRTLSLSTKGLIEHKDEGEDNVMAWGDISKFEQTKFHIYLYVSDDAAVIIPKEAIIEGDLDAFIEQTIEQIKSSAG